MGQVNSTSHFETQADKIEHLLRSRYGVWIPAYELADVALQYCARINSLRKKLERAGDRERIQNKTEWVKGQCHGSYRIAPTVEVLGIASEKPQPGKSWEEIVSERNRKLSATESSFELVP
jgi:hypothetical protein